MIKRDTINKPVVKKEYGDEWGFIYPKSYDVESVDEKFWGGVQLLGFDNIAAEKTFKQLILKYPYYIDAYNHLSIAFKNQNKTLESLLTAEKAYQLGKECFPKEFNFNIDKLSWLDIENRPFLRACHTLGLEYLSCKNYPKAIEIYTENLQLNENDNQGIRYLLLEVLFLTKDYKGARQLIKKYSDDYSIEFTFGAVALDVIEKNIKQADKNLKIAIGTNEFFVYEVIKDKHTKPLRVVGETYFEEAIAIGSKEEAYDYWSRNKALYKMKSIIEYFKSK